MKPDSLVLPEEQVSPAASPEQTVTPNPELRFEMSAGIGHLIEALAKARKAFKPVLKESSNPFFKSKYADLAAVIDATKEGLSANGLAVLQPPIFTRDTGTVQVITLLAHSSGQWIRTMLDMPVNKTDAQGVGSAITYGRRYSYSGVLNVASEEDDDGNAAVAKDFKRGGKEESAEDFDQRTIDQQCISAYQVAGIADACKRSGKTDAEVEAYLGLIGHKQVKELLKSEFAEFLKWANSKTPAKGPIPAGMKPASQIDSPTQKAMKRLFALANEHKIPEGDLKNAAYEMFSVKSMTELSVMQLDEMVKWVKSVAEAVSES